MEFVCLQKTKMETILRKSISTLSSDGDFEWRESPAINMVGGLVCTWNREGSTSLTLGKVM